MVSYLQAAERRLAMPSLFELADRRRRHDRRSQGSLPTVLVDPCAVMGRTQGTDRQSPALAWWLLVRRHGWTLAGLGRELAATTRRSATPLSNATGSSGEATYPPSSPT